MRAIICKADEKFGGLTLKNGESIRQRQLRILKSCGLNPIFNNMIQLNENADDSGFIILYDNIVFDKAYIQSLINNPNPNLAAVNKKEPFLPSMLRARLDMDKIIRIAPDITGMGSFPFYPLMKFDSETFKVWLESEGSLESMLSERIIKQCTCNNNYIDCVNNTEDYVRVLKNVSKYELLGQEVIDETGGLLKLNMLLNYEQAKTPMLICDNNYPIMPVTEVLKHYKINPIVYDNIPERLSASDIENAVNCFKAGECDMIISAGARSAIDLAKFVKIFFNSEENISDAIINSVRGTEIKYDYNAVKHIAVPACAGDGSESSRHGFIFFADEYHCVSHDGMIPDTVILDSSMQYALTAGKRKTAYREAINNCLAVLLTADNHSYYAPLVQDIITRLSLYKNLYFKRDYVVDEFILTASYKAGKLANRVGDAPVSRLYYEIIRKTGIPYERALVRANEYLLKFLSTQKTKSSWISAKANAK
jgi:hypothetical protein